MKKVLVEGYAKNNLGDDLFFSLLVKRYLKTRFIFNFSDETKILKNYNNVDLGHFGIRSLILNAHSFDVMVLIGGSMFQEGEGLSWLKSWLLLLLKVLIFKMNKKKVVFIGFNFGPYHSHLFLYLYRILFYFVDALSVRDKKTFALFKKNKKVHLFPDIVFSMIDGDLKQRKTNSLAISVMDFGANTSFQNEYEIFLEKVINSLDKEICVNLYGFQRSASVDDLNILNRVESKVTRKVNKLCYDGNNMNEILKKYYRDYFAITTRFHSLVLSLKAHQKIISIDYNIKVGSLLETLKIKNMNLSLDELKSNNVINVVVDSINSSKFSENGYYEYATNAKLAKIITNANKHFEYLDSVLGDESCGK